MDTVTYALLNKKIKGLTSGIQSAVVQGTTIVFTMNDGSQSTMTFPTPADGKDGTDGKDGLDGANGKDGADGISIVDVDINDDNELICTMSNGTTVNAGKFPDSGTEISLEDFNKLTEDEQKGRTWYVYNDNAGGGSGDIFDRTDLTLTTVGGLNAGSSVFGKTANEVIEEMLYPYQKPTVTFTISPSTTTYESGITVSTLDFSINVTKKSKDIQAIEIYDGSALITSLKSNVASGGTFNYKYACSISANTALKVVVSDGTSSVTASRNILFVNKSYYGYVADGVMIDEAAVMALQNSVLKTSKSLSYSGISCADSKIVYAYPQSFGLLSGIYDSNGFGYIDSYDYSIVSVGGVNYYVYVMKDPTTVDGFTQKFE